MQDSPRFSKPTPGANTAATAALRVLVVDDEPAVRNGLAIWLTERKLTVVTASNLESAMTSVVEWQPDVILLDIKLGPQDGLKLVGLVRSAGLEIPCVALTAHAGPYDGFKARELGVVALIEKPSSPDEIVAELQIAAQRSLATAVGRDNRVGNIVRFVDRNFRTKGLSLEALARSVKLSPRHLSLVFRREMTCSVHDYIHRQRVSHAAHLLKTTDLSVKAIADECGYHGSSQLNRHFKTRFGTSPLAFRSLPIQ